METVCEKGGIATALNAKIYGNGSETLVLAHGYGEDQSAWQLLLPLLACYFKVVVFDMVFSPNVNPKLYDPQRYQTDFKGYINDGRYYGGFERSEVNEIYKNIEQNFTGWVQNFAPKAAGQNNTATGAKFEKTLGRMKPYIALTAAKTVFSSDFRHKLPQVMVPCTIIQSKKDVIVPQSVAFYIKNNVGGDATVKILNTEGHFPHLSAHNLLFRVLKETIQIKN
ncbi:hypothetical protein ES288_D09G157300v1 [Gossypium darwinii]|uniref:AB hydrolase-1 domain-containing protein n=1 Tax=Gossypium darwinii TaxID=34276 RepID=A0A5D2BBV5_GOSDA|nr:hypothetical protein ES288_D09G157300v1 [Gossypium darwinii]